MLPSCKTLCIKKFFITRSGRKRNTWTQRLSTLCHVKGLFCRASSGWDGVVRSGEKGSGSSCAVITHRSGNDEQGHWSGRWARSHEMLRLSCQPVTLPCVGECPQVCFLKCVIGQNPSHEQKVRGTLGKELKRLVASPARAILPPATEAVQAPGFRRPRG